MCLCSSWLRDVVSGFGAGRFHERKMADADGDHEALQLPSPHAGSGTGWQPASVPAHEWMRMRGGWELMAHGMIFVDYNQQGGPRGAGKAESVNGEC